VANLDLSKRIRSRRKQLGLTQVALADKLSVHKITVAKWEGGFSGPDRNSLRALALALSVSMEWLLNGGESPAPAPNMRWLPTPEEAPQRLNADPKRRALIEILAQFDSPESASDQVGIPKDRLVELADGHGLPNPEETARLERFAIKAAALRASGRQPHKVPAKAREASLIRFPEGGLGRAKGPLAFDRAWVRATFQVGPEKLAIFTIEGDAMEPTLQKGDLVLAQEIQSSQEVSDGLYLLRNPSTGRTLPRRLHVDLDGRIHLTTDSVHPSPTVLTEATPSLLDTLYRILWQGRRV